MVNRIKKIGERTMKKLALFFVACFVLAGCRGMYTPEEVHEYKLELIAKFPKCEDELNQLIIPARAKPYEQTGVDPYEQMMALVKWEATAGQRNCK